LVTAQAGFDKFFRRFGNIAPVFVFGVFESDFLVFDVVINFLGVSGFERRADGDELVRDDA